MLDGLMRNLSMDVTGVAIPEDQRLIFFKCVKCVRRNIEGQISALDKDINILDRDINIHEDLKITPNHKRSASPDTHN